MINNFVADREENFSQPCSICGYLDCVCTINRDGLIDRLLSNKSYLLTLEQLETYEQTLDSMTNHELREEYYSEVENDIYN